MYARADIVLAPTADEDLNDEQREELESSARHLYGLIHARYVITSRGLSKMIEKYKKGDFGRCPRVLCYGQSLLPLGLSDIAYQKAVKLYCPRCEDLYSPKSSRHGSIDGAYFGSTFAHMLFMVYPGMIPSKSVERIRPRIFGFQVHEHAKLLRWQEKIRDQCVRKDSKVVKGP
uniref:Casein kinase II subunit beta n=1 Tax=Rhodotorula toruloides TaxID=5286 RepID=A0A0K3C7J8_RHOTO